MTHLFVGLIAEGPTDHRFLKPVIENTLIDLAFLSRGQIDVDVRIIKCDKGNSFPDYVINGSKKGHQEFGINILIVHTDADSSSSAVANENKILPAKAILNQQPDDSHCKSLIALIPVHSTESWMLADKNMLLKFIGTKKNEVDLNINGNPETFKKPKDKITEAIRIGRAEMPKKLRNSLDISDLYSYLGQAIKIEKLKNFQSYIEFENNLKEELINLNLLPPEEE